MRIAILFLLSLRIWPLEVFSEILSRDCSYSDHIDKDPIVYWINLEKSVERRTEMERQFKVMGIRNERFPALSMNEIYIPQDLEMVWNTKQALYQTGLPQDLDKLAANGFRAYLTGLYGRRRLNRLPELGCTISHLLAIRKAVFATESTSRYAIIVEDDVIFPFNIDWDEMAASAPKGFGILQLFNSNEESMVSSFDNFRKASANGKVHTKLWHERFPKQPGSFWSTCAYMIDREVMRGVLDTIITAPAKPGHPFAMRIIAGIRWECVPVYSPCCLNPQNYTYSEVNPCVFAPKGFQADSFIYATTKAFVLNAPLIANGLGGNQSTFHQDHVENIHFNAFMKQRRYINSMLRHTDMVKAVTADTTRPPPFARPACGTNQRPLDIYEMQLKRTGHMCFYTQRSATEKKKQPSVVWLHTQAVVSKLANGTVAEHRMKAHMDTVGLAHLPVQAVEESALSFEPGAVPKDDKECEIQPVSVPASSPWVRVRKLCGKGDDMSQVSRVASHLLAMFEAIYNKDSTSKFALIAEEDVVLPFDVDWLALSQTAPKDAAMLQLFSPDVSASRIMWWNYLRNSTLYGHWAGPGMQSQVISRKHPGKPPNEIFDERVARAYLIQREAMRPVIDKLVQKEGNTYIVNLEARAACPSKGACVRSSRSLAPESFLFSLVPAQTFMLVQPIVATDIEYSSLLDVSRSSTRYLGRGNWEHKKALPPGPARDEAATHLAMSEYLSLKIMRNYMNNMIEGSAATVPFVKPACKRLLPLHPGQRKDKTSQPY